MPRAPYDEPSTIRPVDGEVTVVGPGPVGVSITPQAARETARRLGQAADRAEDGHVERIDPDDVDAVATWAQRLGVSADAVRNAVIAVGGDSEAVAMRLVSARGAVD